MLGDDLVEKLTGTIQILKMFIFVIGNKVYYDKVSITLPITVENSIRTKDLSTRFHVKCQGDVNNQIN